VRGAISKRFDRLRRRGGFLAAAVAVSFLAACGGDNWFRSDPAAAEDEDRIIPMAILLAPDSGQRVAVGDSVLVRVHVMDDRALARVELSGFALRGSVELGTQTRVDRFETKVVDLEGIEPAVRDTILARYLLATSDTLVEAEVRIVARATDTFGNVSADTVRIEIGGPRVHIVSPGSLSEIQAGTDLKVRVVASDTEHPLQQVRLVASGAVTATTSYDLPTPRASLDTLFSVPIPSTTAPGSTRLQAIVRNAVNDSAVSPPIEVQVTPGGQDIWPPTVRFSVLAPGRAERTDSIEVTVVGTDNTRIDRVGVTLLPIHRLGTGSQVLTQLTRSSPTDSATFRVALAEFGLPMPTDTSTLRVEVTAFAVDTAGNCATATVPNTVLTEGCPTTEPITGVRPGARYDVVVVRGQTLLLSSTGDRIADIIADGSNLFLSNISRNRLEVLPIGGTAFGQSISVGSRPWGLALNKDRSRLYVANSGGTNISVVSPSAKMEVERILTPNVKLYDVAYEAKLIPLDPTDPESADSINAFIPSSVVRYDYSDRPQYIGVTHNENLVYSTLPTAAARDGTVRVFRTSQSRLELVTEYAEERVAGKVVVVNADSAFLVEAKPDPLVRVCPRNRSVDPGLDLALPKVCFTGPVNLVDDSIASLGYDTRFLYNVNIDEIGLADTTFVAVSGDHSTVAIGEGARNNGRIMSLSETIGSPVGPLLRHGEVRDLVGNTAERIIGLSLNFDGSLGAARGNEAYFFSRDLRLQGVVETEPGGGGIEMHANNPGIPRAFVSGVTPDGFAFIDVMDTFHFRRVARIFLRDPVTGPVRGVLTAQGALKIYAITEGGLVAVDVYSSDL
jgi:hypothetical protein